MKFLTVKMKKTWMVFLCFGMLLGAGFSPPANAASQKSIVHIQKELQALGYLHGKMTGVLDKDTRTAVTAFQQKHGLKADGIPGKKTRLALKKALQHNKMKKSEPAKKQ
jgi:peptidoglycan hydrolase-like protein with peptidoglycan-binding domain